jgi:hypothetical protein
MTGVPMYARTHGTKTIAVGGVLPRFVTPSDVRALKTRVDPFVRAMDQAVAACATVPQATREGWGAFSAAWRTYFAEDDSWLHTAAQMDQGEAYEQDLAHWQDLLAQSKCGTATPRVSPTSPGLTSNDSTRLQGTIKTVAIAGAVVAVALGLRAVLK